MPSQRAGWALRLAAGALAASYVPGVAHAEDDGALVFPIEATISRWSAPPLALNGDDVSRRIVGLPVSSASTFYGLSLGFGYMAGDLPSEGSWGFGGYQDMFRLRYAWAVGDSPGSQPADGTTVTVTRSAENLLEISAPVISGMGLFVTRGRFLARLGFDWGWAYLWTRANAVYPGGSSSGGSVDAGSAFLRFPAAACLLAHGSRNDGVFEKGQDACLTFSPTLYEFGWLTGWSAGVRVDL
jgi:hypothetical protein